MAPTRGRGLKSIMTIIKTGGGNSRGERERRVTRDGGWVTQDLSVREKRRKWYTRTRR
jgi:hypothetical protein